MVIILKSYYFSIYDSCNYSLQLNKGLSNVLYTLRSPLLPEGREGYCYFGLGPGFLRILYPNRFHTSVFTAKGVARPVFTLINPP